MFKKLLLASALIALPLMFSGEEASAGGFGIGYGYGAPGIGYGPQVHHGHRGHHYRHAYRPPVVAPLPVYRHPVVTPYPSYRHGGGYGYGGSYCPSSQYGRGYGSHYGGSGFSLRIGF